MAGQRAVGGVLSADSLLSLAVAGACGRAFPARSLRHRGMGSLAVPPRGGRFGAGRPRLCRALCRKRVCRFPLGVLEPFRRLHVPAGDRGPGAFRLAFKAVGRWARRARGPAGHGGQPGDLRGDAPGRSPFFLRSAPGAADGMGKTAAVEGSAAVCFELRSGPRPGGLGARPDGRAARAFGSESAALLGRPRRGSRRTGGSRLIP